MNITFSTEDFGKKYTQKLGGIHNVFKDILDDLHRGVKSGDITHDGEVIGHWFESEL